MDKISLDKLNYYDLKEIVKSYCVSGLGKTLIDKLEPSSNLKVVNRRLDETSEGRKLLDVSYHLPLEGIHNIFPLIDKMDKGGVLEPSDLTMVSDFLRGCRKVKMFLKDKEGYAPTLCSYAENISDLSYIEEEINISIRGSVVDSNASKDLKKIRKQIDTCEGKIKEKLDKFLRNSSNKECIQEFFISQRNGRYTIPIKAAYKNKVAGSIVEVSSKGTTVFMEPDIVSKFTSELNVLQAEESMEVYKILAILTEMIYQRIKDLKINVEVISEYDMIWAKAKYSLDIQGIKPKINDYGYTKILKGRYPLIKNGVPLDFEIGKDYRTLIITGPNAGGKTVVLKTLGMLTLAVQSGFHIGAKEGTEISIFQDVFVDIGDNQSVENALSTFSSHVQNLARIIKESGKSTLLLFDEIGSGTEPNEGAALAIAILEELYHKGCITVATTHYGEIKDYSHNHPDFENAAMEFKNKDYNYATIKESKKKKVKEVESEEKYYDFSVGDKVLLLDKNDSAIIYKGRDEFNNVVVLYDKEFIEVNYKRVKIELKAEELYPEGYDLNQLFVSYKDRKLERDIERGSKKALKKLRKEGL